MQFDFIKTLIIYFEKDVFSTTFKISQSVSYYFVKDRAGQGPLSGGTVPKKNISAILNLLKFMLFGIEMNFKNS